MTFLVSDEVATAVATGGRVVALETSVIGQGLPQPRNLECIERMSGAIRAAGAVPAWIGLVDGAVLVGLDDAQLERFATSGEATKVARRDVPIALARGELGATTVSATIWAAHRAGIPIGATGGTGGVHPGPRPDVSADLLELARTPVLLVCSGPKSIVDPLETSEKLEELGVAVIGYGVDRLPFFLAREAPVELDHRVDTPAEAAALVRAQRAAASEGAILLCNPVPPAHAMTSEDVIAATHRAETRREAAGIRGKAVTPFLLAALAEETGGRSLEANLDLLEANARLAAEIAVALSGARSG
ncbi:MAG TPA: pseudouridine-5'-phosphate glycosidase [Actinomycetota bacterium]